MADEPKKTDQDVFDIFGVGKGDVALRKFISGQRAINGSLYRSIEDILDHLNKQQRTKGKGKGKSASPRLLKAKKRNDEIPGKVAPFCR
jgi:hypothetical protein